MMRKSYDSPNGRDLRMEDIDYNQGVDVGYSPQPRNLKMHGTDPAKQRKGSKHQAGGGVVGHQQYGNWQEHNNFFQPAGPVMASQDQLMQMPNMGHQGMMQGASYHRQQTGKVRSSSAMKSSAKKQRNRKMGRSGNTMQGPPHPMSMSMSMMPPMGGYMGGPMM